MEDNFLAFTDSIYVGLYQVNAVLGTVKQLLAVKPENPVAVAVNKASKDIYWTDYTLKTINQYDLTTRKSTVIYTDTASK